MVPACVSVEPFALRLLDDSMAPEVPAGAIVIVDPGEPPEDGRMVVVEHDGELLLRRLRLEVPRGAGAARLVAPGVPERVLDGQWRRALRGVVTAVRIPGKRASRTA